MLEHLICLMKICKPWLAYLTLYHTVTWLEVCSLLFICTKSHLFSLKITNAYSVINNTHARTTLLYFIIWNEFTELTKFGMTWPINYTIHKCIKSAINRFTIIKFNEFNYTCHIKSTISPKLPNFTSVLSNTVWGCGHTFTQ